VNEPIGRITREDNKLRAEDRAVHDWYRFVLSFPPHLVRTYIERFGITSPERVLDPFCGTGTTLVECKKLGLVTIGVERNPMACFASRVKLEWDIDPEALIDHAREVARLAIAQLEADGITDEPCLPLFNLNRNSQGKLRELSPDAWKLLLRDSISPLPLHKTLVLLEVLEQLRDERFDDHERLALAQAVVFNISNLEFGPEVGVGRPLSDVAVVST
jgi:hypothetical protein